MATKSIKAGEKRKATGVAEKTEKKFSAKKNGPESTRKMWRNEDASDDSSDDDGNDDISSDAEDEGAALPAKKKVKQDKEDTDAQSGKKFEKGMSITIAL